MSNTTKNTTTKEEGKNALVPKLRFPEFRGAVGWTPVALGEASVPVTERVGERKLTPVSISAGIGFVPQAERFGRDISGNQYQLYTLVRDGDFVFNKGNSLKFPQGCIYLLERWGQVAAPNVFICFRMKDGYSNGFFQQCFEQNQHGRQLKRHITSGARSNGLLNISKDTFFGVEIPTPSPAEQQKIAECLSSVDELIATQAQKLDALKTHKKGLMQQLFPREDETQPRFRFPEFQNTGEWEIKTMGSFASFSSGGTPSKDNPAYWNGSIPWVSASSMYDLIIKKADHYVTPLAIGKGTRIAKKGSILILVRGSMLFKRVPICIAGIDVAFNQDVKALDVDTSINTSFLLYQLSAFQSRIPINETGIGAGKIELEHLKGFELFFPEVHEQQRIADCLTNLDDLITTETKKLEALKAHKKGLMQQLFPSLGEAEA
ncbi:restriction endonuclease subunit S [Alishewanella sp. HH-ZS]|uniref:restriction endonuclease subunit S n=1 Tax=Alishewanella sp. HH-ZS TaxID=1856684 RepID=UPI0008235FBA|nr:restriction endonuclease subunit S [Alishewanella sp. HH-ZS]OCW97306.1 restriction endonuclease subunit R [Alishewanella sp. HH-ZS]